MKYVLGILLFFAVQVDCSSIFNSQESISSRYSWLPPRLEDLRDFSEEFAQVQKSKNWSPFFLKYPKYPEEGLLKVVVFMETYRSMSHALQLFDNAEVESLTELYNDCHSTMRGWLHEAEKYREVRLKAEKAFDGNAWCGLKKKLRGTCFAVCMRSNFYAKSHNA